MLQTAFARKGHHESLIELGLRVHASGFIAGGEGNLSCRLPGGQILITPAGRVISELVEADLALLAFEKIPITAYARSRGSNPTKLVTPFLPDRRTIILGRHGAITWGKSAEEALSLMEQLEQVACIMRDAFLLGNPRPLPESECTAILEKRKP